MQEEEAEPNRMAKKPSGQVNQEIFTVLGKFFFRLGEVLVIVAFDHAGRKFPGQVPIFQWLEDSSSVVNLVSLTDRFFGIDLFRLVTDFLV